MDPKGRVLLWEVVTYSANPVHIRRGGHHAGGGTNGGGPVVSRASNLVGVCGTMLRQPGSHPGPARGDHTRETGGGGGVMDRIISHVHLQGLRMCWIWVQAQHDSRKRDWLSNVNRVVDAGARVGGGRRGHTLGHGRSVDGRERGIPDTRGQCGTTAQKIPNGTTQPTPAGLQGRGGQAHTMGQEQQEATGG